MYNDELYHYGVKGMKWGVRRARQNVQTKYKAHKDRNEEYRAKMAKVAKNERAWETDRKLAKFASKSTTGKVTSTVATNTAKALVGRAIMGKLPQNKDEYMQLAKQIAKQSAMDYATNEALAKSASKKYNNAGKALKKQKGVVSREDVYQLGIGLAKAAYPLASHVAGMKYGQMKAQRAANEAKFNAWGGRILEAKYDDIVGLSSDAWRIVK